MNPAPRATGTEPCRTRPEWFYSEESNRTERARVEAARNLCRSGCPIFDACLEHAIRHEVHGIWGATSPEERAAIRKTRGIVVEQPAHMLPREYGHGTEAGAQRHRRAGTNPCAACRAAEKHARDARGWAS